VQVPKASRCDRRRMPIDSARALRAVIPSLLLFALFTSAHADAATFRVGYVGSGHFSSSFDSTSSNQSGDCVETRTEDTKFSWVYSKTLTLHLGSGGLTRSSGSQQPIANPLAVDNSSHVTVSDQGAGCVGSSGTRTPTQADCTGESMPWPGEAARVSLSAAPPSGRSTFSAGAIGISGLHTKDFTGAWTGSDWMSCADFFGSRSGDTLGLPVLGFSGLLRAKFPVSVSTLANLRRGRFFRVNVRPGHYAPTAHQCAAGTCSLQWKGTVRFTRTG
jgi:hypothetical protein